MKRSHLTCGRAGFSLVELMIATACASLIAGAAFAFQSATFNLFRQNTSINASHEGARSIIDRLEKEIQSAISIPALVGTNRDVLDTTGPAPGVAFLRQSGPLRRVAATVTAGSYTVVLDSAGPSPVVGQRLLIPAYDIEGDIVSVAGSAVTLAAPVSSDLNVTSGPLTRNIIAVVTDVVAYVVINTELREYQNAATNVYNVVAVSVTEPKPFGLPYNAVPNVVANP